MIYLLFGFIALVFSTFLIRQAKQIKQIHRAISFIEEEMVSKEAMEEFKAAESNEDGHYMKEVLGG